MAGESVDETAESAAALAATGAESRLAGAALQSALEKERKQRKEVERERKELADRLQALEDADKSENQRLKDQLDRLTAEATEREQRYTTERDERERIDRVRRAAADFDDPEDVIALLKGKGVLGDIESDADAERVLKQLARDRPKLLRSSDPVPSGLEQILKNGQPQQGKENEPPSNRDSLLTWEQMHDLTDEQFQQLKQTDPERYWKSLNGPEKSSPLQAVRTPHRVVT